MASQLDVTTHGVDLHRYNKQLPPSYKSKINSEWVLMKKAMYVLINSINKLYDTTSTTEKEWGSEKHVLISENYSTQIERYLAALEKGIDRYLDLKFPLESSDYQLMVNCLTRGILSTKVDLGLRCKLARCVSALLNKKHCVLPDGLDWRPIRDIIVKVHIDCINGGPFIGKELRDSHARNMVSLLSKSRNFLTPTDNAEAIWTEFYDALSKSDVSTSFKHLLFLSYILPTRGTSWTGWVPPAFELWKSLDSSSDWDTIWIDMFARLARHQPLICDWTPYLPWFYFRMVPAFRLPLGKNAPIRISGRACPIQYMFLCEGRSVAMSAVFAIYSLSPQYPSAFDHLERLLAVISNYFHPSNGGRWSHGLGIFLAQMAANLSCRVMEERKATSAGVSERVIGSRIDHPVAPKEHRLTSECIDRLLNLLLPLIKHGLYSKTSSVSIQAASAARDLAIIDPDRIIIPLLEEASDNLESVSSPHRTTSALRILAALSSVFFDSVLSPSGEEHLLRALQLTLPGIDPNDTGKTDATFRFIGGATASLRSRTNSQMSGMTEEFLEEYIHELLNRIFAFLESMEAPSKKDRFGSNHNHAATLSFFSFTMGIENVFAILPKAAILTSARRIIRQVVDSSCTNGMKYYGLLIRTVAAASATVMNGSSANLFVSPLIDAILEPNSNEESSSPSSLLSIGETELVWRIRMLAQICRTCGSGLTDFVQKITTIIDLAFQKSTRPMYKAGGRLLRGFLEGLTSIRTTFEVGGGLDGEDIHPDLDSECFSWYIPKEEDMACGESVLSQFMEIAEKMCNGHVLTAETSDVNPDRDVLFRVLRMLHAIQRGGRWLLSGNPPDRIRSLNSLLDSSELPSEDQAILIMKLPVAGGLGGERDSPEAHAFAKQLWERVYALNLTIIQTVLKKRPDDGALIYRCLEPIELAGEPFRYGHKSRQSHQLLRFFKTWFKGPVSTRKPFETKVGVGRFMPRFITKYRIEAHQELRVSLAARSGMAAVDTFEAVVKVLMNLSLNQFPSVRGEARTALSRALRITKPWMKRQEIKQAISKLEQVSILVSPSQVLQNVNQSVLGTMIDVDNMIASPPGQGTDLVQGTEQPLDKEQLKNKLLDQLMGASAILRSAPVAPLLVRDWDLFFRVMKALFSAVLATERPDASKAIFALFGKLASLVRPLRLRAADIRSFDSTCSTDNPNSTSSTTTETRRDSGYINLCNMLLGTIDNSVSVNKGGEADEPMAIKKEEKKREAHWRLQCLVAFVLYVILRVDRPPPPEVARFFAEGLTSDLMELRFISTRAIMLILTAHGKGSINKNEAMELSTYTSQTQDALREVEKVVTHPEFFDHFIKTMALDQDGSNGEGGVGSSHTSTLFGGTGGLTSILGISRFPDGDMYWMGAGGMPWPSAWIPRQRDSLNLYRIRLYELLISVFGPSFAEQAFRTTRIAISKFEKKEDAILGGVRNEDARVVIAEALGGITRGLTMDVSKNVGDAESSTPLSISLLKQFSGPVGATNGSTLIRLINTSNNDSIGRNTSSAIMDWLLEQKPLILPSGDGTTATQLSRRVRYLHACIADEENLEIGNIDRVIAESLTSLFGELGFDHGSKTVREEVARCLAAIVVHLPSKLEASFDEEVDGLVQRMTTDDESTSPESNGDDSEPNNNDSKDDGEVQSSKKKSILRQGETLSTFISLVMITGRGRKLERYVVKLLPLIFRSFDDNDPERLAQYRAALALLAQGVYQEETIADIVTVLNEIVKDSRWRVRGSILPFIQVFSFISLFLAKRNFIQDLLDIINKLLSDVQLEVRQAAASNLLTIIRDAPPDVVKDLRDKCVATIVSTRQRKKKGKRPPLDPEILRKRHGAVLGLSSMVTANPYTIPDWVPDVLDCLAGCVNDPPPISTGVREVYANFSRTHRDEWSTHKLSFTQDQLETISELLISPSYFA